MAGRRRLLAALLLGAACALAPADAAAQCVMCSASAEGAENARGTFLKAVGMMLIPTVGLLSGAGVLLWKFRNPGPPPE